MKNSKTAIILKDQIKASDVVAPSKLDPKDRTFDQLLADLESRREPLSFSSLRAFMPPEGNPRKFLQYKLNKFQLTAAIQAGNVLDMLVTEGEEAALDHFYVVTIPKRNTKIGKEKWAEIQEAAAEEGKEILPQEEWDNAKYLSDRLLKNPASRYVLDQITSTQEEVQAMYKGWLFRGRMDFSGPEVIADLKRKKTAVPKKVRWQIMDANEIMQLALYDFISPGPARTLYSIVIDATGDITVVEYSEGDKRRMDGLYSKYIAALERCIVKGEFYRSHDFWAESRTGIYKWNEL